MRQCNKQLEIDVLNIELNGLLTLQKTETANLNVLKERDAKTNQYNADMSLYHAINDKEQKIEEIKAKIREVKAQIAALRKKNEEVPFISELSEDELKVLVAMNEAGNKLRTFAGIGRQAGLSPQTVNTAFSGIAAKGLVAEKLTSKNQSRWYLTDKGKLLLGGLPPNEYKRLVGELKE